MLSIAAPDHVLRSDRFDAVVEADLDEANRIAWSGEVLSGSGSVTWDGTDNTGRGVVSGIYFYRLETGKEKIAKKMILLR